jgi:hypothetical protein
MRNIFSAEELAREVDPNFAAQAAAQRGGAPVAPNCNQSIEHQHVALAPMFEDLARRTAPGSAVSADPYTWRR